MMTGNLDKSLEGEWHRESDMKEPQEGRLSGTTDVPTSPRCFGCRICSERTHFPAKALSTAMTFRHFSPLSGRSAATQLMLLIVIQARAQMVLSKKS